MKKTKFLLAALLIAFTFVSCDTSENNSSDTNFSENFGAAVSRDFIGQVVDADNHPIQGVNIKIGTTSVQTDVNGVFIINGASVNEKFAYITAKKSGYIDGSRAMVPTSGKNNVRIMLIQDTPLQTIQSGVTSEVSIYSGTKVVFDGAFMDESGAAYSGSVDVSMFHLTPSDENISKLMPGMLYAETASGAAAVLETFGMLHVELRGSNGQKLQIATGHSAQITLRIDDSQLATCPTTIPLWHFDETKGYWKEDGSATKVGNYYVGNVSHFSWWNCDIPNSSILLTFNFVDENGSQLSNIIVSVLNSNGYHATGITDNNGQLSGMLPANQIFSLNLYNNNIGACSPNGIYYSANIGSFNSDTVLPNFVINNQNNISLSSNVVGTLVKCDNTNVTNGYVLLSRLNDFSILPVTDGTFSFNEIFCSNNTHFNLKGIDYDTSQATDSIVYNFVSPITNVGNLPACNSINEFISYKIDNSPTVLLTENLNFQINVFGAVNVSGSNPIFQKNLSVTGQSTGSGTNSLTNFHISGTDFGNIFYGINNTITYNSAPVGPIGTFADVTFNGTFKDSYDVNHYVTGLIHIIRN